MSSGLNIWEEFGDLRKKVANLSSSAECQAWGILGVVAAYSIWTFWNKFERPFLTPGQFCFIAYALSVSAYAVLSRSYSAVKRCLFNARILFLAETVTESEYTKMRSKCLKKSDMI